MWCFAHFVERKSSTGKRGGGDAFRVHRRWSPFCGFIRCLFVENIPIGSTDQTTAYSEQPARSRVVCGTYFELRSNSQPEHGKNTCLYFFFY